MPMRKDRSVVKVRDAAFFLSLSLSDILDGRCFFMYFVSSLVHPDILWSVGLRYMLCFVVFFLKK